MKLIRCFLSLSFLCIVLSNQSNSMYSIQCCTSSDNTCSSKPVDCPSNICFKLVINRLTEERGCLDDLIKFVNFANKGSRTLTNENHFTSGSSNDQCQKLGIQETGMSLCKCTNNLCNSSSKLFHFTTITFFLYLYLLFMGINHLSYRSQ